jgi:XTP/dITP diphosphohydrolase
MPRQFQESKLVIASHNPGKVREIAALLEPFGCAVVCAADLGLNEPEETGTTFAANAELKARAAAKGANLPALADDSGLAVTALNGEPGILSARWAGPGKDFRLAMQKVEDRLAGGDDRSAHFVCVLALCWPDDGDGGHMETFEGRVDGTLVWPLRGDRGFGYDPMFVADSYDITFGQMDPAEKHRISHRADAFRKLVDGCFSG